MVPAPSTVDDFEVVVGLEVHAQLTTASKMFCRCSTGYSGSEPNTHVCPVCMGMPGVLPVINARAVEHTITTGLALNCQIPERAKFDRKNYPYPDLMKGYQISEYDQPLCVNGYVDVEVEGERRRIRVNRVHLEEDTARLLHRSEAGEDFSLLDVNRAGMPLMEIVTEPDARSPAEAMAYLTKLRQILRYLGVSDANMEEGNFRCEPNLSLRPKGATELGAKVELKNLNSFRAASRGMEFEVKRQAAILLAGGKVPSETRGWREETGETASQRSKELAHDYRYFPEPDLPPLAVSREQVEELRRHLPELPEARRERLIREFDLLEVDATALTESRAFADYFEEALRATEPLLQVALTLRARLVKNWMLGELSHLLNRYGGEIETIKMRPTQFAGLVALVESQLLERTAGKRVLEEMYVTGRDAASIVTELGLQPMQDEEAVIAAVKAALAGNEKAIAEYRAGKTAAINALVGAVMKETRGRASAPRVRELLEQDLMT